MAKSNVLDSIPTRQWKGLLPSLKAGRFHLLAVCERCGESEEWITRTVFDPNAAVARAQKAGWETGQHIVCPACKSKKKEKTPMAHANDRPILEAVLPKEITQAAGDAVAVASDAAKKAKRMVYMALEDYYDDGKKAYKAGHSDALIAKELGVAEAFVAKIREEDFGPIAEPSELTALRRELVEIKALLESTRVSFSVDIADRRKELEKIEGRHTAFLQSILDKQTYLQDRLSGLCTKNGWRA